MTPSINHPELGTSLFEIALRSWGNLDFESDGAPWDKERSALSELTKSRSERSALERFKEKRAQWFKERFQRSNCKNGLKTHKNAWFVHILSCVFLNCLKKMPPGRGEGGDPPPPPAPGGNSFTLYNVHTYFIDTGWGGEGAWAREFLESEPL
jgi:hypothetical protein